MLLREFWNDRFWPYCMANLRESTCVGYESAWRLHVMPVFGGMDMGAISVELVDKWLVVEEMYPELPERKLKKKKV